MLVNADRDFLQLLGWEGEELEAFLPEWLDTKSFLGLSDEDVDFAVREWIPKYWDIELLGIRKCIAALIREVADAAKISQHKAEGQKILYANMPASPVCVSANKIAGGDKLHVAHPDYLLTTVLSAFFNKENGGISDNSCMDMGCHHCVMNCVRADVSNDGRIPPPTVTWNWGLLCNEAPKTEEMIGCMKGPEWKDVFITIPHDAPLGSVEAQDDDRVQYLADSMRDSQREVSELTGIEVTDEHLRVAMDEYMEYLRRLELLIDTVVRADPQPMASNELNLFAYAVQVSFNTGYSYLNDAIDTAIEEVKVRIEKGEGQLPKGAPRLACHFNPLSVPWVNKAFTENGVSLSLGRLFPLASTIEKYADEEDIYVGIARQCLSAPNAVNMMDEARIFSELLDRYSDCLDGVLYGFYSFDRWIGALQKTMMRVVEDKTGLPHFYLEGDFWSGVKYSFEDRIQIIRSICNYMKITAIV